MAILDEVLAANARFVAQTREKPKLSKLPKRRLAIVTCMDTRLIGFLEDALGIERGEANVIKNAGNTVVGPFEATIRSLVMGIFELDVAEIIVVGHHDCGVAKATSEGLVEKMLRRGISEEAIHMVWRDIKEWVDEFAHSVQNVELTVRKLRSNPLIPADIPIHGMAFDPETGKADLVVNGYARSGR